MSEAAKRDEDGMAVTLTRAELRELVSDAVREALAQAPRSPEERAEFRRILRLLRRGAGEVDSAAPKPVREAGPALRQRAAAEVTRIKRRKGLRSG